LENQFDLQFFIEGSFQVHEAAGNGDLMDPRANLAFVGQA
jgi:hypothetical protein